MHSRHPDRETLQGFLDETLSTEARREVADHLAACPTCKRRTVQLALHPPSEGAAGPKRALGTRGRDPYGKLIERTYQALLSRDDQLRREREDAPELLDQLTDHPPARQLVLINNLKRYRSWGLAELAMEQASEAWFSEPRAAEKLARLGLAISRTLTCPPYSPGVLSDLQARGHIYVGNCRRLRSDFLGADQEFRQADVLLDQGSLDPLEKARYHHYLSSLRRDQRRLEEAFDLLNRAIRCYQRCGNHRSASLALVSKANIQFERAELAESILTLEQAREGIDPQADPFFAFQIRHNLINTLAESQRYMEARALLNESTEAYRQFANPMVAARHAWIRGKVAGGLGQTTRAEAAYSEAKQRFLAEDSLWDAGLVTLDLAIVLLQRRRFEEIQALGLEMLGTFQALGAAREALASFSMLVDAARAQSLTTSDLAALSERLTLARPDTA